MLFVQDGGSEGWPCYCKKLAQSYRRWRAEGTFDTEWGD